MGNASFKMFQTCVHEVLMGNHGKTIYKWWFSIATIVITVPGKSCGFLATRDLIRNGMMQVSGVWIDRIGGSEVVNHKAKLRYDYSSFAMANVETEREMYTYYNLPIDILRIYRIRCT